VHAPASSRTPAQVGALAPRNLLLTEVVEADAYLFTVPMYNWAIPSTFKAGTPRWPSWSRRHGPIRSAAHSADVHARALATRLTA